MPVNIVTATELHLHVKWDYRGGMTYLSTIFADKVTLADGITSKDAPSRNV